MSDLALELGVAALTAFLLFVAIRIWWWLE